MRARVAVLAAGAVLLAVFAWSWAVPRVTPGDPACIASHQHPPPPPGMPAASFYCGARVDYGPDTAGWLAGAAGLALAALGVRALARWPDPPFADAPVRQP